MKTQYFPVFNFTKPVYQEDPGIDAFLIPINVTVQERDRERSLDIKVIEICANDDFGMQVSVDPEVGLDYDVNSDFSRLLAKVSKSAGHRFCMRKRKLVLVLQDHIKPQTLEEENRLVDQYGEYMRKGGGGDCTRRDDGTFLLRVALRNGNVLNRASIIDTAAHEYGHTLGKKLTDQTFEELKAYAFASLCERADTGADNCTYEDTQSNLHADRIHHLAIHCLGELLRAGVPEIAILSHLVGENIGDSNPNSYLSYL